MALLSVLQDLEVVHTAGIYVLLARGTLYVPAPMPWHVLLGAFRNFCHTSSLLFTFLLGVQLRRSYFLAAAAAAGVMAVA